MFQRIANQPRRFVAVPISFSFIQEMLTQGYRFDSRVWCKQGLPVDAKLIDTFEDRLRWPTCFCCVFEHESFEIVPEGQALPIYNCAFVRDQPELKPLPTILDFEVSPLVNDVAGLLRAVSDLDYKRPAVDGTWREKEPLL